MSIPDEVAGIRELLARYDEMLASDAGNTLQEKLQGPEKHLAISMIVWEQARQNYSKFDEAAGGGDKEDASSDWTYDALKVLAEEIVLLRKAQELAAEHLLDDRHLSALRAAVESALDSNPLARITFTNRFFDLSCLKGDWFDEFEWTTGGVLDSHISYRLKHPALLTFAKTTWDDHPRVAFDSGPLPVGEEHPSELLLRKYNLPDDLSSWFWAAEALQVAERGLNLLDIDIQLNAYVRWSSSERPGNMSVNSIVSEPVLLEEVDALFGFRLQETDELKRIDAIPVWEDGDDYVSPLWEYLAWGAESRSELAEVALCVADIGEGLDAAAIMNDPNFDPEGTRRFPLTATEIFRAGQATTKLRVKLELEEKVLKGARVEQFDDRRGALGAAAQKAKAQLRKQEFRRLALRNPLSWVIKPNQAKALRDLALDNHRDGLFSHGGKPLSLAWFENELSELRTSGELERRVDEIASENLK